MPVPVLRRPHSLTARLVATAVLLVAVFSIALAAATTLALHTYLDGQLERDVLSAAGQAPGDLDGDSPPPYADRDGDGDGPQGPGRGEFVGQGVGTLRAFVEPGGRVSGGIVDESRTPQPLATDVLAPLADLDAGSGTQEVTLPGLGEYRVVVRAVGPSGSLGNAVTGLPESRVRDTLTSVIGTEVVLTLLGVLLAGAAAAVVVRRQLRPLREVATTAHAVADVPLARGEVEETARVPTALTDERTEVGQVGSALNTLLDHVEDALRARHASEQQVRQFVADASHELRTPLATIKGYAELTRRTGPAEETASLRTAMDKVEVEAQRMSSLVEDLLLLARLDAGRPLEQASVDLTLLVLEDVADARVLAPDHRWVLDLPEDPVSVTGDEQRLHQTLRNLLGNARRHTPPGTTVTVRLRQDPLRGGAVLTVHDDGPGIEPDLAARAFERFARGDAARTRASGSVGLGLSLVQAITHAHGGTVELDTEPGSTSFVLHLPA